MRIGFVGADTNSLRVRASQLRPGLVEAGNDVRIATWNAATRQRRVSQTAAVLRTARWSDVCILVKPRLPPSLLRAVAALCNRIVIDIDDATFDYSSTMRTRLAASAERAETVIVGSEHLARRCAPVVGEKKIVVIRPSVDVWSYPVAQLSARPRGAPVRVGWIGTGAHLRSDFVEPVRLALADVATDADFVLEIISDREYAVEGVTTSATSWSIDSEARSLASLDIGIMPLADDPISLGRCGLKCIQYMAAGLPVVASAQGVGPELVRPDTGFVSGDREQWRQALARLVNSPELRVALGARARAIAEAEFTLQHNVTQLLAVVGT